MEAATSPPAIDTFLDRLVFLSNSVPKSGSTFLFGLQESLLLSLANKTAQNFDFFTRRGVKLANGFVWKPHDESFIEALSSGEVTGGPYVLKLHTMFNARLREVFLAQDNIFASLAIRDPVQIFFSARDNFEKTGEFGQFADKDQGCQLIEDYFTKILKSVRHTAHSKPVPIVRYETIVTDPFEAMTQSFGPLLASRLLVSLAKQRVDVRSATNLASNRFNLGGLERPEQSSKSLEYNEVSARLEGARREFGYL